MNENIIKEISEELKIKDEQVSKTLELLMNGNTIPFIARYRKEMTGEMSDVVLRQLYD